MGDGEDLILSILLKTLASELLCTWKNRPSRIGKEFEALELGGHREESGAGFISDGISGKV